MENWTDNKDLVKAYEVAFDEAYGSDSARGFLEVMEKRMSQALTKHLKDKLDFEDVLEEIMADAEDHYMELSSKYGEMQ